MALSRTCHEDLRNSDRLGGQLHALTALRFLAAIAVVLHHVAYVAGNLPFIALFGLFGWLGVSFFFLLSGFVIMWSYNPQIPARTFILRRLTRIYPLHLLTLLVALALCTWFHSAIGGYRGTPFGTVANVLLVHDWVPLHPDIRQAWNGVSWSLSCELFFYLCAPFLLPRIARRDGLAFAGTAMTVWTLMGSSLLLASVAHWSIFLDICLYHPVPRLLEFILGALGACWLRQGFTPPPLIFALALMLLPAYSYVLMMGPQESCPDVTNILFTPGAFLLILSVASAELAGKTRLLHQPWFILLGEASFALYMTHALLLGLFSRIVLIHMLNWPGSSVPREAGFIALYLLMAVGLSVAVHSCVEVPLRLWLLQLQKSMQQADPTAVQRTG